MTVTIKGRDAMRRKLVDQLPKRIAKVLEGAARAGGRVIAEEAKARCENSEVAASIKVKVVGAKERPQVSAKVQTSGHGAYLAPWLEYGTTPHVIAVRDDRDRKGLSVNAINRKAKKEGTLAIGGQPVGPVVHHPGARPHPFLRPAVDHKAKEAVVAAQAYIIRRMGTGASGGAGDDD